MVEIWCIDVGHYVLSFGKERNLDRLHHSPLELWQRGSRLQFQHSDGRIHFFAIVRTCIFLLSPEAFSKHLIASRAMLKTLHVLLKDMGQ